VKILLVKVCQTSWNKGTKEKQMSTEKIEPKQCICGHSKGHHKNGKCSVVIKQHQEWLSSTQACILIELCSCTEFHSGAQKE